MSNIFRHKITQNIFKENVLYSVLESSRNKLKEYIQSKIPCKKFNLTLYDPGDST